MRQPAPALWRIVLLFAVTVLFVLASTAAAMPLHWHADPAPDACAICTAGHSPAIAGTFAPSVQLADSGSATCAPVPLAGARTVPSAADGRAPPRS